VRPRTRPLTFADFELPSQGLALEATLPALADFLDEHAERVTLVHDDLVRGLTRPRTGRDGLSAAQVLRAFVLQRLRVQTSRGPPLDASLQSPSATALPCRHD